ncbi:TonB-dependent hemoglobin/transferrin/lactoferrin family receptor [Vibrio sp. WXL103]|uniref:TonB-dependent hemoglobin/transferrin/lactoferrin family receptor n=1 Tax=Vibrio sp. WXL103 TaxID=3450710 RepID=UPI003EC8639E
MSLLKPNMASASLLLPILTTPVAHANNDYTQAEIKHSTETMVVVASRTEQSINDVAGSVALVSADDLEKQLASDIEQSLRYVPGVSMNGNARFGATDFNVRGMDGSRVKVLVDGVEQPISYGSGISGTVMNVLGKGQGQVEVDTLQAIEVNKGSSSSLYGSGALGGSVLMRTKNADDLLRGSAGHVSIDAGYQSSDDSYKTTINAARQLSEDVKAMLIFTHREGNETSTHGDGADVLGEERGAADPMSYSSNNILTKVEVQASENHHLRFTGQYFEQNSQGKNLSFEGTSSGFDTYSNYRFQDKQQRAQAGIEHQYSAYNSLFDNLTWKANWQYSRAENQTFDTLTGLLPGSEVNRERQRDAQDSSIQLDVQFDKTITTGAVDHDLIYGFTIIDSAFELETRDITDKGDDTSGVVEMPPKTDVRKAGLFAQDQMYLMNDRLILTAGLRYDMFQYRPEADSREIDGNTGEYHDLDASAFTGHLGGIFHFTDTTSGFAKYSRGFKAPTPEELYYSFERNPVPGMHVIVLANPDLNPETSDSIEVGLRQNYALINWELSAYYNDYNDFINSVSWEEEHDGSTYLYQRNENVENARIYGIELTSMLHIGDMSQLPTGSFVRMAGSWSEGEDKDTGNAIDSITPLTGVFGIGFDRQDRLYGWESTLTAVAGKRGSDWSNENNLNTSGYGVVDVTAYAQPVKNLTVRGGVFNLFDKKYTNYSRVKGLTKASVTNPDALTSPGMNFGLNAKYVF